MPIQMKKLTLTVITNSDEPLKITSEERTAIQEDMDSSIAVHVDMTYETGLQYIGAVLEDAE